MELSIIIVNYKVTKQLLACLESIRDKVKGIKFEVIVIENDPDTNLSTVLRKYAFVKYIKADKNLGFGAGNNLGAKTARGEYLFFLNPDTEIKSGNIKSILAEFNNNKVGIVAPLLQHKDGKLFELQGLQRLTPVRAFFSLSIINKIFPKNPISKRYWMLGVDRSKKYQVDVVPGTAFIIKKNLFEKLGGFDENFFLYFEEMDLCNRVLDKGYKLYMSPALKVFHAWGESTKRESNINKILAASRFYYFKKNYGSLVAYLTTWLMDFNLNRLLLIVILILSAFVRFNNAHLTPFIPDQGWFYLSARDMILGHIPLVGITSSHTWLHQGPFWTYLLVPGLLISSFNPIAGVFIAATLGVAATIVIYKIGSDFFAAEFGLIAAMMYASSPLVISHERMAYHTAPISLLVSMLIYFQLKWIVKKSSNAFLVSIFLMAVLYNFELATVVLWSVLGFLLLTGYFKKTDWFGKAINKKVIILSIICFLIPMIPVIIYDFNHGFVQTIKFAAWLIYSPFKSLVSPMAHDPDFIFFTDLHLSRLVFLASNFVSWIVLIISLVYSGFGSIKKNVSPIGVVVVFTALPMLAYVFERTGSEAYLPMLFPGIILILAWLIYGIYKKNKIVGLIFLLIVSGTNIYLLVTNNYLMLKSFGYGWPLNREIEASKQILRIADNNNYNLTLKSSGFLINDSVANYEYLTWWLGNNPPYRTHVKKQIQVFKNDHKYIEVREITK